jgi:hypothetical protein
MPGHYSTRCYARPHPESPGPEIAQLRFFLCARCRAQVYVCRCCDRGQSYCAGSCAQEARVQAQQAAGRRYQVSRRARLNHAARTARHRARQKIVTHQGSPSQHRDDVVASDAAAAANKPAAASSRGSVMRSQTSDRGSGRCHRCGYCCSEQVRIGFLPRRQRGSSRGRKQGEHDDYST